MEPAQAQTDAAWRVFFRLVQRLRNSDDLNDQQITFACTEAADEIERLRRENEMLRREFGGHDPHDDFSEQNNPFPVSPLRDQVAGIGRADYPAAAEVEEPPINERLRMACQSALDALERNDSAWAAAQLNTALTAAAEQKQWPKEFWDEFLRLRKWEEIDATIERCIKAVWDAGGDNVEFHCAAIRALKETHSAK